MNIVIKTPEELEKMRVAGALAASLLDYIGDFVEVGVSTEYLDDLCAKFIADHNSISACLNYGNPPYPKHTCISTNHIVCHGIPDDRKLKKGDILNIDTTVIVEGFHGDSSRMYVAGEPSIAAKKLIDATYEAMWRGIEVVKEGATLGDIGKAIQKFVEAKGFSVVRDFCGHGIGRGFHEDPQVLHYYEKRLDEIVLKEGMTFTIEPMINAGKAGTKILPNKWTAVTRDRSLSAQFEHMLAVRKNGYEIFTLSKTEKEKGILAVKG